jgi:trimeric autotransporter adhesin
VRERAGSASASLSVTSSASGSAQTVSLSGTASQSAFTVAPPPNGSGTTTVKSGQTADYNLVLTPVAGYSGTLTLNCGGLPAHAACTFTPPSLTIANGSPANFTVAISTTDAQANGFSITFRGTGPLLGLCLLPLWWKARKPRRTAVLWILCTLLLAALGCGGKSSTPTPTPSALKVAPGTYTVQVLATDGVTTSKTLLSLIVQ